MTCGENCQCDHEKCRNMDNSVPSEASHQRRTDFSWTLSDLLPTADTQTRWLKNPILFRTGLRQPVLSKTPCLYRTLPPVVQTTPPFSSLRPALPLRRWESVCGGRGWDSWGSAFNCNIKDCKIECPMHLRRRSEMLPVGEQRVANRGSLMVSLGAADAAGRCVYSLGKT